MSKRQIQMKFKPKPQSKKQKKSKDQLPKKLSASLFDSASASASSSDILEVIKPTIDHFWSFMNYIIYDKLWICNINDVVSRNRLFAYVLIIYPVFVPEDIDVKIIMKDFMTVYDLARKNKGYHSNMQQLKQNHLDALVIYKNYKSHKQNIDSKYNNINSMHHDFYFGYEYHIFKKNIFITFFKDVYSLDIPIQQNIELALFNIDIEIRKFYDNYNFLTGVCCFEYPTYNIYMNHLIDLVDLDKPINDSIILSVFPNLSYYEHS